MANKAVWIQIVLLLLPAPAPVFSHAGLHEQIEELTRMILQNPQDPELYLRRGELYRAHQDWRSALQDYDRAEQIDPDLKAVDLYRGKLWLETNQFPLAKAALDRFLNANPDHAEALATRARVQYRMNLKQAAVADYTRAIALKQEVEYFVERAEVLASDEQNAEEALAPAVP